MLLYYYVIVANKYAASTYIYSSLNKIEYGTIVAVQFRKQLCRAICLDQCLETSFSYQIKSILHFYKQKVTTNFIEFCIAFAKYNLIRIGSIIESSLNAIEKKQDLQKRLNDQILFASKTKNVKNDEINHCSINLLDTDFLTENQQNCAQIISNLESKDTLFLAGVTGSGKTLTALEGIKRKLLINQNQLLGKILIIAPEITLARNWTLNIEKMFGIPAYFYHYKISAKNKQKAFNWALSNNPGFIVGARSALFLPYRQLKFIIVDEEHSSSLRQDYYPRYNARDMAVLRSNMENISCILLSATPSLETLNNVQNKKYKYAKITRQPKMGLAECLFFKLEHFQILSKETEVAIQDVFTKNEQVLFFLNRKGYAPYCICQLCNTILECKACDSAKILYSNGNVVCHKCFSTEILPTKCSKCKNNTTWKFFGMGIEKLQEELLKIFPNKRFRIISSNTKGIDEYIQEINDNEVDGIIATQVLAQGHDFKNISLVVILDADKGLNSPDFRASEKMYQLWQQLRGRSGRHEKAGKMIVQFFVQNNRFIELLKTDNAYELLMKERKDQNWPPFSRCGYIIIKSKNPNLAKQYLDNEIFLTAKKQKEYELLGPLYIGKQSHFYEWRFLIRAKHHVEKIAEQLISRLSKKAISVDYENA